MSLSSGRRLRQKHLPGYHLRLIKPGSGKVQESGTRIYRLGQQRRARKSSAGFLLSPLRFVFNTFAGLKSTDSLLISVIRFDESEKGLYLKVFRRAPMPYIIASARLAIVLGVVGIIVGEFYAASEGIGFVARSRRHLSPA